MRLEYDRKQLEEVKERVRKQLELIKNAKGLLPQIATIMYQSVMKNFQEEGTDKQKWKPLSIATIMGRRKGRGGGRVKILQDTGYLRTSIVPRVEGDYAIVGTNVHYARIHQFGGVIPKRYVEPKEKRALHWVDKKGEDRFSKGHWIRATKIPARPFLWLRKEYQDKIINLIARYLRQQ
jgi:phage virion morphogenesis protein